MGFFLLSQRDRLSAALNELRMVGALDLKQLGPKTAAKYAANLTAQKWAMRRFSKLRTTIPTSWRGDELTTLHEMSYYLLPRALWARRREARESWVRREQTFTLLALVQHQFGREAGKKLRELYVKHGVKYRPRRQISAAQRAELAKRSKFKKTEKVLDKALTDLRQATLAVTRAKTQVAAVTGKRRITLED